MLPRGADWGGCALSSPHSPARLRSPNPRSQKPLLTLAQPGVNQARPPYRHMYIVIPARQPASPRANQPASYHPTRRASFLHFFPAGASPPKLSCIHLCDDDSPAPIQPVTTCCRRTYIDHTDFTVWALNAATICALGPTRRLLHRSLFPTSVCGPVFCTGAVCIPRSNQTLHKSRQLSSNELPRRRALAYPYHTHAYTSRWSSSILRSSCLPTSWHQAHLVTKLPTPHPDFWVQHFTPRLLYPTGRKEQERESSFNQHCQPFWKPPGIGLNHLRSTRSVGPMSWRS